ncbi:3'-5' exonuclease [Photobacterium leiognathi]|uniref:3'-5' exonuclease n=1 Tax=Photobacterium leiognathi TaxID=553611 RepID=UPI00298291E2|nr:hypothetical protein [Photobacterium leiognathi]
MDFEKIEKELINGKVLYLFCDTETTGVEPYPNSRSNWKRDRILDIYLGFYTYNKSTKKFSLISEFHNYINPFKAKREELEKIQSVDKIGDDTVSVHGITKNFLEGSAPLKGSDFKLSTPAKQFKEHTFKLLNYIYNLSNKHPMKIVFVAYNSDFDIKFIDSEMELVYNEKKELCSFLQINMPVWDPYKFAKKINKINQKYYGKKKFTSLNLDALKKIYNINTPRQIHGAKVDTLIMIDIIEKILLEINHDPLFKPTNHIYNLTPGCEFKTGFNPKTE